MSIEIEDLFGGDNKDNDVQQQILDLQNQLSQLNPRNLGGIRDKDIRQATRANIFGDGSDGNVILTGNTTLTRDMFYKQLTINNGVTLNTAGFRWFSSEDTVNNGTIACNGGNGGAGATGGSGGTSGNTGGAGGTAGTAAYTTGSLPLPSPGEIGGAGGNADSGGSPLPGANGTNGDSQAKSIGAVGSGGGAGGAGGSPAPAAGGSGGNGGSLTGTVFNTPRSPYAAYLLIDTQPSIAALTGSAGSGSGAGGGAGGGSDSTEEAGAGGGGGGSGASGGVICGFCYRLINNGVIEAKGGNGGAGGAGGTPVGASNISGGGGGGGGAGGPGGVVLLCYGEKSGAGTISVAGGTGGAGGAGGVGTGTAGTGVTGTAGTVGSTGTTIEIVVG